MFVPFDVVIPSEERDDNLLSKLKAEASGILNWMLEGLKQWQAVGLQPLRPHNAMIFIGCSAEA